MEQGDKRPACCRKPENLEPKRLRPDVVINVCRVCGRKHYEVTIDPMKIGVVVK